MTTDNYTISILNYNSSESGRLLPHVEKFAATRRKKDPYAYAQEFPHTALFRTLLVMLVIVVGNVGVWGQIDEGFYYIANNAAKADGANYSYSNSDQANRFYLCPAIGSYYDNNVDHPYLTTFKTDQNQNSLWKIKAVEGATNCYYLIHYKTGKYLASNETPNYNIDSGTNRRVVHLENKVDDSDIYKFYMINHDDTYQIYPADYRPGGISTDASTKSLNVKGDNWSTYVPYNGLATGIIGVYDYSTASYGSQWKLEPLTNSQPCATPVIKYNGEQINISYPYIDETGITIYYTTDGTEPTTSSTSNASTSFNISASGVVKVRAFATKSGYANSDEAVLLGSARPFLIQSKEDANYYLVPDGNGTNVNTTSIAGQPMQWTLQNAGASTDGVPYYYLVNSNGKKINYNSTDYNLTLNTESTDANKFCIIEDGNTGGYFIIPINGASTGNDKNCRAVYKTDGNVKNTSSKADLIKADNQNDINRVHWLLRVSNENSDQKSLFANSPFSVSTDEEMHYYHIKSVGSSGYYIIPTTNSSDYVSASNASSDYTDKPWFFKVAASDNWLTYYYIINAETGEYMYFNIADEQTNTMSNVISMKNVSEKTTSNEDRFQFIMVRSTTPDACYIVPKGYANNFRNSQYYGISVYGTNPLQSKWSRSDDNSVKWTFESTTYANVWTDPEIACDLDGHITITNGEEADGAEFYYTINSSTTPPATPTATETETNFKYNSESRPTVETGFTTIKVRALASGKGPSNVVTKTIVYNPTIEFTAGNYTYTGLAQNPTISSVSVGETQIDPTKYVVKYKKEGVETPYMNCVDAGTYTILLTAAEGSDYVVSGTSSESLSIAKATLTVTADDKSVTYGSAAPTYTVSYSGFLNDDSEEDLTTPPTAFNSTYSTTSNVGTYPIGIRAGEAANYSFSYKYGTLTVTPATATVTADEGKTKVYGEADPELTATVTGLQNSDTESVITYTLSRAEGENVGTYAITPSGEALQGNYSVNYVSKDFTITKAPLTVTAKNHAITYGDAPANGGVSYSGFVNSDTESALGGTLTYTYSYSQYDGIGNSYTITPGGLTAANYNLSYNNGTLTVNQKEIGLSWDETPLFYNGAPHTLTATATGLVNSDEIDVAVTLSAWEGSSLTDGNAVNAGNYLATASSISGQKVGNYKLPSTNTHLFTISPKVLGDGTRASSGIDVMMTKSGNSYSVTVTDTEIDNNTLLTENTDYTLSEANDVVTISGINNYTGSARLIYATATFATPDEENIPAEDGYGAAYMSAMDILPPLGVKVYVVKKVSPTIGTVSLSEINYIPEGVPVLMLANNDQTGFAASPIDFTSSSIAPISDAVRNSNLLRVSDGSVEVKDAQTYMFYRGEFVLTLAGTIGAGKFFIYNPDYTEKTTPASVRYLQFIIEDDETSINEELREKKDIIATDESWYTLDGQRLNGRPARKGLYIMNGKKMALDGK